MRLRLRRNLHHMALPWASTNHRRLPLSRDTSNIPTRTLDRRPRRITPSTALRLRRTPPATRSRPTRTRPASRTPLRPRMELHRNTVLRVTRARCRALLRLLLTPARPLATITDRRRLTTAKRISRRRRRRRLHTLLRITLPGLRRLILARRRQQAQPRRRLNRRVLG